MLSLGKQTIQEEVDGIIRDIINKEQPDPHVLFSDERYYKHVPYMYQQLLMASNVANCNYYLGLLLQYYEESEKIADNYNALRVKYYKAAAEAGHLGAMYKLGDEYYYQWYATVAEMNQGIELGVKALEQGYVFQEWDSVCGTKYNLKCLTSYVEGLRHKIATHDVEKDEYKRKVEQLASELEQERLRPPEKGGSEYEKAEQHFNNLKQP